jgi:hypothetical protein
MKPTHWLPYIWAKMRARQAKLGETTKVDIVAHLRLCSRRRSAIIFWRRKFRRDENSSPSASLPASFSHALSTRRASQLLLWSPSWRHHIHKS